MGMGDVAGRHPRCRMTASQRKSSHHRTFTSSFWGPHTALSASYTLTLFFGLATWHAGYRILAPRWG